MGKFTNSDNGKIIEKGDVFRRALK